MASDGLKTSVLVPNRHRQFSNIVEDSKQGHLGIPVGIWEVPLVEKAVPQPVEASILSCSSIQTEMMKKWRDEDECLTSKHTTRDEGRDMLNGYGRNIILLIQHHEDTSWHAYYPMWSRRVWYISEGNEGCPLGWVYMITDPIKKEEAVHHF